MSFLAPLFLLGALAVTLPVLFHLVRKTTRERTVFSSLMFLRAAPPRLTRRNRLEHLLLLALRCAVIGLLALGFARPFWRQSVSTPPAAAEARKLVVLLDVSASMRRGALWPAAQDRASAVLRSTTSADQVAVFRFDHQLAPVITFEEWAGLAVGERVPQTRSRLASLAPGWGASRLDQALIRAAELLAEVEPGKPELSRREVVIISDLQAGCRLEAMQGHEWPKGIEVRLEPLPPLKTSNAGLQLAADAADTPRPDEAAVRLRVSNEPDSRVDQFEIGWQGTAPGFLGTPLTVYVPAGQNRIVALPSPPEAAAASRILLHGDEEPFDNTLYTMPPQPTRATVLYLGRESPTDIREARYFLDRALQQTRRLAVSLLAPGISTPLAPDQLESAALIVVTDALPPDQAQPVADAVRQGKTVLFAPKTPTDIPALAALPELAALAGEEGRFSNYGLLGEIDFRHPLFAVFADPRFSDFTKIHFWKYRRLNVDAVTGATVLARFDNGDPALIEVVAGKGRVFVLASGWHAADSQLALSSKFVPLLYSMLELGGARPATPAVHLVGDQVPLGGAAPATPIAATVLTPEGATVSVPSGQQEFGETRTPGIYTVVQEAQTNRFAINLDPAESRTAPLPADELERLSVPMAREKPGAALTAAQQARLQSAELESRQKLWRWLIFATLVIVLVETWLAGRTAHRSALPLEAMS